ncbi:MAG: DUF1343 domain-containing protein [Ruminococcaceae bacterium]|nr:DUF1343 domain-containing protein [Oscillospiraceae bacterium]
MKHSVLCGIDRFYDLKALLEGKRVALLTAASGVNKQGLPSYQIIREMADLRLIFAPEHGLSSAMQDGKFGEEDGAVHGASGAGLYNLTSKGHPRLAELISEVDIAVYDIQDVGARFYTYLCNLTQLMRACANAGKTLLVLDRPNPIGNTRAEGLILDESRFSSFIGEYAIPTRYGLTVGEYARYVNTERGIGCDLIVLSCLGWKPEMYYDETDLLFVNPSPNIPSVNTAINYIGGCVYEATNLSEGRGTTRPFDYLGAPFVDGDLLWKEMNSLGLPGVVFRRMDFTPMFNKHAGEICHGVELHITDRDAYQPFRTMLHMFKHFKRYPEFIIRREGLALRVGQDVLAEDYDPEELWHKSLDAAKNYEATVAPYRIYRS